PGSRPTRSCWPPSFRTSISSTPTPTRGPTRSPCWSCGRWRSPTPPPEERRTMRVLDVLECCLYAEEVEESARFYETVLGLRPFSRSEGRHVFFRCGGRVFLLFAPGRTSTATGEVPPHGAV